MNLTGSSSNSQNRGKKGFALILTLALISFVFLLVITLVNQVRMEFSFTESRQNQILAKAHARMGMMIAIGEIQKHLGPDTRVSATADIYDERLSFSENSSSVDLNEDGVVNTIPLGQRMWTGVWKNRGGWAETKLATRPLPENRDDGKALTLSWSYDSSYDPHPAVESAWLVSGNEGWKKKLAVLSSNNVVKEFVEVPDGIIIDDEGARVLNKPTGDTYGKAENPWADHKLIVEDVNRSNAYYHPLLSVAEDEQRAWLLKYPVLGEDFDPQNPAHQNNWEQYLVGEPVAVPKTAIHDADDTDSGLAENQSQDWGERKGSYAYWVADEGVKAKINISVPELTNETKLKVASSPNIGEGSFGIKLTPQKEEKRKDLLTINSLSSLLDVDQIQLKSNLYHSMTADSFGVLADVRTGGLKRDLSLVFSLDQDNSEAWRKDFESNFLFRDRVRAMKNIPLEANAPRNRWYDSANDATVDDPNALLAGPPWSVLADFHNTRILEGNVSIKAPDQFPRTVGDNALIFGRFPPQSPRGAFANAGSAYPYYNCFSSSVRKIRPEPKNHPVLPILTKCKFSLCPVAIDVLSQPNKSEFALALSPAITLWNPYSHEMLLEDLYLEIPSPAHHGQPEGGESKSSYTGVDLAEYDLYRKWWAVIFDTNNTHDLSASDLSISGRSLLAGKVKNKWEPWGLYDFEKGTIDKSTFIFETRMDIVIQEPGLLGALKMAHEHPEVANTPPLDPEIERNKWDRRETPDSLFGIKLDASKTIFHESPRDVDYSFGFKTFRSGELGFSKLIVRIMQNPNDLDPPSLLPGEVATFAVYIDGDNLEEVDIDGSVASVNVYKWESGAVERASLLKSGVQIDSNTPESVILQLKTEALGIAGYSSHSGKLPAEKFNPDGSKSNSPWGNNAPYADPICLTLWQGHPVNDVNPLPLTKWTAPFQKHASGQSYTTSEYLKSNLNKLKSTQERSKMMGLGWEVNLLMPGEKYNERIPLVEFNSRALVHSNQHGQGGIFGTLDAYTKESQISSNYFSGSDSYNSNQYDSNNQLPINSAYTEKIFTSVPGKTFVFNGEAPNYIPKAAKVAPDFFEIPDTFDFNKSIHINFNRESDVYQRATLLGLVPTNKIRDDQPIFDPLGNPDFKGPQVDASYGQDRVGYFATQNSSSPLYSGKMVDSRFAVLFEVPERKILSLLQYRHANLNNYLHGPSYALGSSYASTQVARHRTWGRVQNIALKPTSEQGLTDLAQNFNNYISNQNYLKKIIGDEGYGAIMGLMKLEGYVGWAWDEALHSEGFGAWRSENGQQNYQNTTVDHSYYLNRSIMDGFFLSGSSAANDYNQEAGFVTGQKFRPYLWAAETGIPVGVSDEIEVEGNHRLVGYFRRNSWDSEKSSYGLKSKASGFSTSNDLEYLFQTVAGDLLLDGAFNINSTSLDAWVAQLTSLRGLGVENASVEAGETPVVRFLKEPDQIENNWNELRVLTDDEIEALAKALIKQVKLRGPFLSMADFVNRRLAPGPMDIDPSKAKGTRVNFVQKKLNEWTGFPEDRYSAQGLRGAVQAAIAEAQLNDEKESDWISDSWIPKIPNLRYDLNTGKFFDSSFGIRAGALNLKQGKLHPSLEDREEASFSTFGAGKKETIEDPDGYNEDGARIPIKIHMHEYKSTNFGEAPENLLAVEHLATGANKPGWVMQSDLLSPLIPVTSARSDTFVIRVQGDTNSRSPANAWIELVVQRTPDYVKPDLDAPHHRPHEPFKDINLNGFWDNGRSEHWIDLNQNADVFDQPDLPGVGELGKQKDYRDGLLSDLKLNMDPEEEDIESQSQISYLGTNQRFGRKFKIVRFRWLRANEV
jgi:hypothetical protein